MLELQQPATFEQVVKKSRFLATALPVASEEEAKAAIAAQSHADANHNCWAWRIGQAYRFSDDGEPSGTAGKPILAAINGQNIDKVVVIVTRWFGGILLGSGGLVRAYGGTAGQCLKGAQLAEVRPTVEGAVHLEFSDLARVKARLQSHPDLSITDERFGGTGAELIIRLAEADVETVSTMITDLTSGRSQLKLD
ncbi:IMPACT family protein [Rhizobium sp. NTR19]|uniref:IMPACT family protein n=1 Tax=Neorhizobium turbinariae TaxID=2937795 RepID=A0ABT0IR70_9HYPH|nr:YigZ family protein [Neorhizobium turbinariae]MCK8780374.1 IMPACT family protein [Neorhizobium turbinariae]